MHAVTKKRKEIRANHIFFIALQFFIFPACFFSFSSDLTVVAWSNLLTYRCVYMAQIRRLMAKRIANLAWDEDSQGQRCVYTQVGCCATNWLRIFFFCYIRLPRIGPAISPFLSNPSSLRPLTLSYKIEQGICIQMSAVNRTVLPTRYVSL